MRDIILDSFRTAFSRKLTWAAILVVPLIVALFGLLYVYVFMDPYERMKELPVAVVNLDEGTESGDVKKNYGAELAESILKNDTVRWTEETGMLLDGGPAQSPYYMAVIIPRDFSAKVSAGETSAPRQAEIIFFSNERKNAMLSALSSRIENEIYRTVNAEISKQYTEALAEGLYDAKDGFDEAADGAGALSEGADELANGIANAYDGALLIEDGAENLAAGGTDLRTGAENLRDGTSALRSGAAELPANTNQLAAGTALALAGIQNAENGAASLREAAAALNGGLLALREPLPQISSLSETAAGGIRTAAGSMDAAAQGAKNAHDAILSLVQTLPDSTPQEQAVIQSLTNIANGLYDSGYTPGIASGVSDPPLYTAITQISAGLYSANPSAPTIFAAASGIRAYAAGASSALGTPEDTAQSRTLLGAGAALEQGLDSLEQGLSGAGVAMTQLNTGAQNLASGSLALTAAIGAVDQGAASLKSGTETLLSGLAAARDGTEELTDGLAGAADGANELFTGAADLNKGLADGSSEIGASLTAGADAYADYIAEPIAVQEDTYGELEYFGYGYAPMFLTLCFWLGGLLLFFIFSPFPSEKLAGKNRFSAVFGRWPLYLLLLALEIVFVLAAAKFVGIPHAGAPDFAFLISAVAFSFFCIMQLLNLFDIPGKALALLLLIFQLVCASGTLPAILGKSFISQLAPFLPFTYAIDAYREVMSGSDPAAAGADIRMLLIFAGISVLLTLIAYPFAKQRTSQALIKKVL
ncbi:MAG: YhgE/Pip domain-containing protein [Clostridiales Family XIII bacterium]|nr:YhgE/Pip domain-containing protein [Clostridiales Family XIII bacterium]